MPANDTLYLAFDKFLSTVPVTRLKQNLIKALLECLQHQYRDNDNDSVITEVFLNDFRSLLDFLYRIEEVIEWNNS